MRTEPFHFLASKPVAVFLRLPVFFLLCSALVSCANPVDEETPDYCGLLFSYWGVESLECEGDCDLETSVIITRRNNVVASDGRQVLGTARGFLIEIDKTRSPADQISIALHELGHVLLGPAHSQDPGDLMFPVFDEGSARYPSSREFFLAREKYRGFRFQCKFIP